MTLKLFITLIVFSGFTLNIVAQYRDSSLKIIVKDQLGGIVSSAEITILTSDKKEKRVKTNSLGETQFYKLENGIYQIVITHKGFVENKSELIIKPSETKTLEIILEVAPVESKVEISNEDSVQPDDYGMVTVITQEQIQKLPDDPEEFLRALRRLAGESITGEDLPIEINGIRGGDIPPKQLIEQIRIDRNAFSAKYPGAGGGGIQIYTSSRVEKITGFVNLGFADSRLNAADPFLGRRVPYQFKNYRFGLTGPLGKKTSYSFSLSRSERDSNAVINAVVLDANLQPVEYRETFPTPSRNHNFNLTLNSDPFKKHKIYLSYDFGQNQGRGQGVGVFTLPERAAQSKQQSHSFSFSHTFLSERFLSRTRFISRYDLNENFGESDRPAINVAEAFFSGGATNNSSNKNLFFEFANDTNQQWRKISFEYGFSIRGVVTNQDSRSNFNGTYTFNGRLAPLLDANNNPVIDSAGNIITEQITSLESYRRTLLFRRLGYSAMRIRELGGGADQFSIFGGNTGLAASQFEYSVYLQGSYNLRKNLGINIGLRYENQNNIKSPFNLAPRFSLIWSPKKKGKENVLWSLPRISAGTGLSFSRFGIGNILSLRQTNDDGRAYYFLSAANAVDPVLSAAILDSFPNAPSIESLEQLSLPRSRRFFEPGLQTPYDLNSNITFNKRLPAKFAAVFSITHSRGFRRQISRNINAPLAGTFDPLDPLSAVYPFDNLGNIYQISSRGKSEQIRFSTNLIFPQIQLWKKKQTILVLRYSVSRSRDDLVFGSGSPFDPYDFSREFAPTTNDGVQTLSGTFNQTFPFKVSIGGNWAMRSGSRFNITTGRDSNGDGIYSERPSFAADPNKPGVVNTIYGLLDPSPAPGDRIIPRNLGRGPGNINFDMYLMKSFTFGGDEKSKKPPKRSLTFSMTVSNLFNINNKGNPIGNMASPRFVRIISNGSLDLTDDLISRSSPRSMNFSLNFNF